MRSVLTFLVVAVQAGCVGVTAGATAGVARSTTGHTRLMVDAPLGLGTRTYSAANPDDRANLVYFGLVPRLVHDRDDGTTVAGVGPGLGVAHYGDRVGVVGLASVVGLFGAGPSRTARLAFRVQAGIEVEVGRSDWQIDEIDPCGGASRSFRPRQRRHVLVGLLPGVEYASADGHGGGAVSVRVPVGGLPRGPRATLLSAISG